jgi:hypothetical protein
VRLRVNELRLVGTSRVVTFKPGLNVISGEITSGKSSLMQLVHGLFGSPLENLIPEVTRYVRAIQGDVLIGDERFTIIRRPVSTADAPVDVAGETEVLRLPALQIAAGAEATFGQWLLRKLGLPELEIPLSPGRADSLPSPVSINDYFLYCHLRWNEIDTSLLGHLDRYKDRKRRFVFAVVYGRYSADVARLDERLRLDAIRLRDLRSQAEIVEKSFAGTPFENRAALVRAYEATQHSLGRLTAEGMPSNELASSSTEASSVQSARSRVLQLDNDIVRTERALRDELENAAQLAELVAQLQAQSRRLTKSIVAQTYLVDFDFVQCPRCGAGVARDRSNDDTCYLCLQQPRPELGREDLEREQLRLDAQTAETRELIGERNRIAESLRRELDRLRDVRRDVGEELEFFTHTYVSDLADRIQRQATERATLRADMARFADYLRLFDRLDMTAGEIAIVEERLRLTRGQLEVARSRASQAGQRLTRLDQEFRSILLAFGTPKLGDSDEIFIERSHYMPVVWGRSFERLHSPGITVQVNVAHVLAHQRTAIALDLTLPNILLIDGLTSNIGREGLDAERKARMYDYLIRLSDELGDRLQVIVADNDIPSAADAYVRVKLSVDDRLVPIAENSRGDTESQSLAGTVL